MVCMKSPIQEFFTGKNILITGSTGACGKVLLEKILRTLLDVGTIFLLVRPKPSLTAKQRVDKLLSTPMFSLLPIHPNQFKKIIVVEGDVTADGLAMRNEDKQTLINEVQFVFHVAASINFTATFRHNFIANVIGTENLLKFAICFKNLQCFVQVSTAFSNCQLQTIDETLYPLTEDVYSLIDKFRSIDDETGEVECLKYFDGRPNNYIFTKAMAEHVVNSYFPKLPVVIARPPVILPSAKEPIPGFIHTLEGVVGLGLLAALGIIQVLDLNLNERIEFYPVDYLANSLISIAFNSKNKIAKTMRIYNLVSIPFNEYDNIRNMWLEETKFWLKSPSIYAFNKPFIPPPINRMSDTEYKIKRFIYHTIVGFVIDLMLVIAGRKQIMMRIMNKLHKTVDVFKFFANNHNSFGCDNYKSLIHEMSDEDEAIFPIDISKVDFKKIFNESSREVRRTILKEDDSNIPIARIKLQIQCFVFIFVKIFVAYNIVSFVIYSVIGFID